MPATIGWLQAFELLPLLALNTMFQPVGRVLGSSEQYRIWLRASPFLCALDALAVIFRLLTYYVLLDKTALPRKALLTIWTDRFDETETEPMSGKRGKVSMISRLVTFLFSILPLIYLFRKWGEIRWTVAWAWMYIASYAVLDIVKQLARRAVIRRQEAAAEFELEGLVGDDDDDEPRHKNGTEGTTDRLSDEEKLVEGKLQDELHIYDLDVTSDVAEDRAVEQDAVGATSTEATNRSSQQDPEAAKTLDCQDDDPMASARLSYIKGYLGHCDRALLTVGCILHAALVYWALLDLIHPNLKSNILSNGSSWTTARFLLSAPLVLAAEFAIIFLAFIPILLLFLVVSLIRHLLYACFKPAMEWTSDALRRITEPVVMLLLVQYPILGYPIILLCGGIGFFAGAYVWTMTAGTVAVYLLSNFMVWVYELIAVELVILLLFGLGCLILRLLVELVAQKTKKLGVSRYLEEWGVSMATAVLVGFVIAFLWYLFQYPSFESGQWMDNWRGYLDFNTTSFTTSLTAQEPDVVNT